MKKNIEKGSLEYYIDNKNFTDKILSFVPFPLKIFLHILSIIAILSIVGWVWAHYSHLDILNRKHSKEEDIEFLILLFVLWFPALVIGIIWSCIVFSKHYCIFMIKKFNKQR